MIDSNSTVDEADEEDEIKMSDDESGESDE